MFSAQCRRWPIHFAHVANDGDAFEPRPVMTLHESSDITRDSDLARFASALIFVDGFVHVHDAIDLAACILLGAEKFYIFFQAVLIVLLGVNIGGIALGDRGRDRALEPHGVIRNLSTTSNKSLPQKLHDCRDFALFSRSLGLGQHQFLA